MNIYDDLIAALKRESELSTCSDSQKAANAYMINLCLNLKNKRTSDMSSSTNQLSTELLARRLADPNYRFSAQSLFND